MNPRRWCLLLVLFAASPAIAQYLWPNTNPPAMVTLAWDAVADPQVTGYRVYWGIGSRQYTNSQTVALQTETTITNLMRGTTYFFAATSLAGELESGFSEEVTYAPPTGPSAPQGLRTTNVVLRVGIMQAPTPAGPWTDFATVTTTTSVPAFYRSKIAIEAPTPALVLQPRRFLSPKAAAR